MRSIIAAGFACMLHAIASDQAVAHAPAYIVLLIDRSGSTAEGGDLHTQLQGYAAALKRTEVGDALAGMDARLSVLAWSGPDQQNLLLDRARISSRRDARAVAADIRALPLVAAGLTDVGAAVDYAIAHLDDVGKERACAVILVATDQLDAARYVVTATQQVVTRAQAAQAAAVDRSIVIHGFGLEHPSVARFLRLYVATPDGDVEFATTPDQLADAVARVLTADPCKSLIAGAEAAHLAS